MTSYIVRLDDIHDRMNHTRFESYCKLLDEFEIKPILGVIPSNLDESLNHNLKDEHFFHKIKTFQNNGYIIALHGFEHNYVNANSGIMGINKFSEFAGLSYEDQNFKISNGLEILHFYGIQSEMFMAPAHSFDKNTVKVLVSNGISMLTDGFYLYPYFKDGIWYIPQQFWTYRDIEIDGIFTFCFHIDALSDNEFERFLIISREFFEKNKNKFINISKVDLLKYRSIKYKFLNLLFNIAFKILYRLKHSK